MNEPKHKYEVTIKVGANTEEGIWDCIQTMKGMSFTGLRAFISSVGIFELKVNENQTEEKFREELRRYRELYLLKRNEQEEEETIQEDEENT